MSKYKVTNGEYLEFVRAGAKPPHFWTWGEGQWWWRAMSGEVPLPMEWPVYVTHEEASAFAAWSGGSIVAVRVTSDHEGSLPGTLRFAVSDTGIGIPRVCVVQLLISQ